MGIGLLLSYPIRVIALTLLTQSTIDQLDKLNERRAQKRSYEAMLREERRLRQRELREQNQRTKHHRSGNNQSARPFVGRKQRGR